MIAASLEIRPRLKDPRSHGSGTAVHGLTFHNSRLDVGQALTVLVIQNREAIPGTQ
ncbi:MAG TPA: hypothetical protein VJL61_07820 [Rhodanobacteraceae bacterium]|nr:hypothetical protein [Rhodanobacteraceae bacterium]